MTYRAKKLRFNGTFWTCQLEYWEGHCECAKQIKEVEIHQEKRPSLKEIKECVIWN